MEGYDVYRDSGINTIGIIPVDWDVGRFYMLNNIRARLGWKGLKAEEYVDTGYPFLSAFNIVDNHLVWSDLNYIMRERYDESPEIKLSNGDLVLVKDGAGLGKCARIDELPLGESTVNSSLAVITPKAMVDYKYEYYILLSPLFQDFVNLLRNGMGVPHLTQESMKEIYMPLPPVSEQSAIAAFLDRKVSHIDSIIAEVRASIEEYKAWKASIIYEAVTKGLDKGVEMKESGVEWIGKIASHVVMSRVGLHHEIILGKMLCPDKINDDYSLEPYYCAANVHFDGIAYDTLKEMWFSQDEKQRYIISEGDLLVVEGGAGAGGCAIAGHQERPVYIQNSIMKVTPKFGHDIRYLRYLIECLVKEGYVDFVCNKATIPHFTKEKLSGVPYPVFPNEEQSAIADYLDNRCIAIDSLISEKESLIADLEAYKKSLIFEVVTGKRKV